MLAVSVGVSMSTGTWRNVVNQLPVAMRRAGAPASKATHCDTAGKQAHRRRQRSLLISSDEKRLRMAAEQREIGQLMQPMTPTRLR